MSDLCLSLEVRAIISVIDLVNWDSRTGFVQNCRG